MKIINNDVFGLLRPSIDAHSLGVSAVANLLADCNYSVKIGDSIIAEALNDVKNKSNISLLKDWIATNGISKIGYSYRLEPKDGQIKFGQFYSFLLSNKFLQRDGGQIESVFFAGLPETCQLVFNDYEGDVGVFIGDESPIETLQKIGVPESRINADTILSSDYDDKRNEFASTLIKSKKYLERKPIDRSGYSTYGTHDDTLIDRINHSKQNTQLPLMRVHVGPYNPNYREALNEFNLWLNRLAKTGYLDIVSVGSSQLSQSNFGEDWANKPNGGGVPINSVKDLNEIWESSRPMLVRTYAGTQNIKQLAKIYEKNINIAWHALSFWWFCQIDGRGPNTVQYNLEEHLDTLKYIAKSNKPFEPNVPHHFSFRGADDYTYVLSGFLAAKTAKKAGIKSFILQIMLNTPKYTYGIQDLAKARALLTLAKSLEDSNFKVYLQPRAGLDYFSPDLEKAKIQLASVTAMMDDIDPLDQNSPDIIHVVSYSEAVMLANPDIIDESIKITMEAIEEYRALRRANKVENMAFHKDTIERTNDILSEVKKIESLIDDHYPDPYSAKGLYEIFKDGIMPVPYLWEGRDEFKDAIKWKTALINGGVKVVDENGLPIVPSERVANILKQKMK